MADIQNFLITPLTNANINVPRARIEATVNDSNTGTILADFTGVNALIWPGVVSTLSAEERRELVDIIAIWLIHKKAGVE